VENQTPPTPTTILDATGHIAVDLPCAKCRYNLRTLAVDGKCPECAFPVARSAGGNYLHHAPARWVRRLANGALLLVIALCGGGGLWLVATIAGLTAAATGGPGSAVMFEAVLPMLMIVIGVVGLWFVIRGLAQLTTPDPTAQFRREGFTACKLVRYGLIVLPVSILAAVGLTGLRPGAPLNFQFPLTVTSTIGIALSGLVYFVLSLATLRYIATLMQRIPGRGLVIFAKIEFWGLLIAGLLYGGSASTFAPVTCGPNVPVRPSAAGPNSPNAVTATSAPALTYVDCTPTAPPTITFIGRGGARVTTTMPTSGPPFPLYFLSAGVMDVSGRSLLCVFIAGLVLLILVWRALANAARLAEQNALPNNA